jgi:hypothetical protein
MKKLITLLLFLCGSAFGAPFLVCTPVNTGLSTTPTSYTVTGLPTSPVTSPAVTITTGTVQLHLDLGASGLNLPNGSYTVTATDTNSAGTSAASSPFTFSLPLPAIPGAPASLSLSPN